MLEQLFKFPIVMVDGNNEERKVKEKERYGELPNDRNNQPEYDLIIGEAEYPYWDVIGIEDRWLPTRESFSKAMNYQFDACEVRFVNVGQLLVPWTKKKFKAELLKFAKQYEESRPPKESRVVNVKTLSIEQAKKLLEGE